MKSPKLRAYQRTAIESARRALTKSGSCILQMPTGAGKTRAATEIVTTSRGVIWFVCHRQEIERQVAKAFTAAGINFGVVSPRGELEPKKRVQVVSVHTLRKRLKKLPAPKLVIWDECHHVAAKSWASIRAKLKDARHLGLTATPERLDGKGLGEWFAELVTGPGIAELIKKGFLSEFRYFAPSDPDLTNAKLQAGDYKKSDLGKIMNTPVLIGDAVREYKKNAKGKRALAFCASVESSRALAARFNKEGIKSAHVDGTTPTAERDLAVQELAAGRIKVLCNVEVFTEGFDLPAIDAVILMRPTKSPTLLLQMIGRGLRKTRDKDVAIIMDHAGLHRDHAWFADDWHWSLDGGAAKARRAGVVRGPRRCPECKEVRAERVEVCACGYEFPGGREIGEFDGVLTEVRGVVPEGCETALDFARRHGVSRNTVYGWVTRGLPKNGEFVNSKLADVWMENNAGHHLLNRGEAAKGELSIASFADLIHVNDETIRNWIKRGLPVRGAWVRVADAKRWIRNNVKVGKIALMWKKNRSDYENIARFAKRMNVTRSVVDRWIKRGMPCADNGWPHIKRASIWVSQNVSKPSDPETYENKKQFSKRIGMRNQDSVNRMIKAGIPHDHNEWIHKELGVAWFKKNWDSPFLPPQNVRHPEQYETSSSFALRHNISPAMIVFLKKRGLPMASNGWVHSLDGDRWILGYHGNKTPPRDVPDPWNYEGATAFQRRIGSKSNLTRYRKRGLPCASNGWVHIQLGLEWVRDNTNIKIPASAWPKKAAKEKPKRREPDEQRLAA